MAKDDFYVVMFKILSYYYGSIKRGVLPNRDAAIDFIGVNEVYFDSVFADLVDNGYLAGNVVKMFDCTRYKDIRITASGVDYLESNSRMGEIKTFLGKAFDKALQVAITATAAIS